MKTRDFKLHSLVPLRNINVRDALYGPGTPTEFYPPMILTEGIKQVAFSFHRNTVRLDETSFALPLFVYMAHEKGKHGVFGFCRTPGHHKHTINGEVFDEVSAIGWETVEEYLTKRPDVLRGVAGAIENIQWFSSIGEGAIDSWLTSIVADCWTTFEVLAADLWEAALNCHPHGLADLSGKTRRSSKNEPSQQDKKRPGRKKLRQSKQIMLDLLSRHNYDIQHKMGSLLKHKLKSRGLNDFIDAYRLAFSEHRVNIDKAIEDH